MSTKYRFSSGKKRFLEREWHMAKLFLDVLAQLPCNHDSVSKIVSATRWNREVIQCFCKAGREKIKTFWKIYTPGFILSFNVCQIKSLLFYCCSTSSYTFHSRLGTGEGRPLEPFLSSLPHYPVVFRYETCTILHLRKPNINIKNVSFQNGRKKMFAEKRKTVTWSKLRGKFPIGIVNEI